jgi:hypothetical protein
MLQNVFAYLECHSIEVTRIRFDEKPERSGGVQQETVRLVRSYLLCYEKIMTLRDTWLCRVTRWLHVATSVRIFRWTPVLIPLGRVELVADPTYILSLLAPASSRLRKNGTHSRRYGFRLLVTSQDKFSTQAVSNVIEQKESPRTLHIPVYGLHVLCTLHLVAKSDALQMAVSYKYVQVVSSPISNFKCSLPTHLVIYTA